MPTLGQKIRGLRSGKNLSQENFAADFNVARQTVSKWENDEAIPNTENMTALGKYFGVPVEYFTATDGKENAEVAATTEITTTEITTAKKKRLSAWWIVGIVLSCTIPVFDIIALISYIILDYIPQSAFPTYSSIDIDWTFFWVMLALTVVSLAVLVTLIVFYVKKRKNITQSDKMSPKGDRHL